MTRWAFLLLPVAGLLLFDPVAADDHAVKQAVLMAGALVCVALSFEARRFAWSQVSLALWVFVAVRGVMLLNSPMTGRSLRWFGLLLALTIAHHAACATTPRRWLRENAPRILAWVGVIIAVYAVVQTIRGLPQGHAFFANRNFAGAGLAMLLPYALAAPRRRWIFFLACLVGLACMQSRGGLLAGACATTLYLAWGRRELRAPLLVALPVALLFFGIAAAQTDSVKARFEWYGAAVRMGLEHPVAGLGADGFAREFPPLRSKWDYDLHGGSTVHAVHNDYLESFAEGGLPGLGALLFLCGSAAWALRRQRVAATSLVAFAVAAMVDLPLRDPSLLALAFFALAMARRRRRGPAAPATLAGLVIIGAFVPASLAHWRADRAFGRYLSSGDRRELDAALAMERRHPEALIERSHAEDLDLLLAMEPHHAGALYNRTRFLTDDEALAALKEIRERHDPHHRATRRRIAQLEEKRIARRVREARAVIESNPLKALSILETLVQEEPASPAPYLLLARLHRRAGRSQAADRYLRRAEARAMTREVIEERLTFEMAELAQGRAHLAGIARAASAMTSLGLTARIGTELKAAKRVEEEEPAPRVDLEPGEAAGAYAKRVVESKIRWRAGLQKRTRPHYVVARVLAEVLAAREPMPANFRLVAGAVRGEGDLQRAREMEAIALFLETLAALRAGDDELAKRRFGRALRAYPELPRERTVQRALKLLVESDPELRQRAIAIFGAHEELRDALG